MTIEVAVGGRFHEFGLPDRIRVAREENGWTQDELAERAEMSRQTISNYETGATKRVNPLYLRAIARATGFDFEWLKTGEAPGGSGDGGASLPHLDSNQEPAGYLLRFPRRGWNLPAEDEITWASRLAS